MKWEVFIPALTSDKLNVTLTVEAENWMSALKIGLEELGEEKDIIRNIMCDIREDGIHVTDFVTKRVFQLRQIEPIPEVPARIEELPVEEPVIKEPPIAKPKVPALPPYKIFFSRDEDKGKAMNLTYRERLFVVDPSTSISEVTTLLEYYWEKLKNEIAKFEKGKFINLAVFDHKYKKRAKRPAIAVLKWKDWLGDEPEISYPLRSPSVFETSHIPSAPLKVKDRLPSEELQIGREIKEVDPDLALAEVFEEIEPLYRTQTPEEAARFVLDLGMAKIPCEAGSVLLADINRGDLYFAAARGPNAEKLLNIRMDMHKGLVGFAAREGMAVAISDVKKDPRFFGEIEKLAGFDTRSILCAPAQYEGRTYGALELLNRKESDTFEQGEINIVSYIASQLAKHIALALPEQEEEEEEEVKKKKPKRETLKKR
jgi:hypothetical protein